MRPPMTAKDIVGGFIGTWCCGHLDDGSRRVAHGDASIRRTSFLVPTCIISRIKFKNNALPAGLEPACTLATLFAWAPPT